MSLWEEPGFAIAVLLTVVLIASIAAGSLLMIAVSILLLAILAALAFRAHAIRHKLDDPQD